MLQYNQIAVSNYWNCVNLFKGIILRLTTILSVGSRVAIF